MAELAVMAATTLGATKTAAATVGTIASVGLTAASAFGSVSAGQQQQQALDIQSQQSQLNARVERLKGREQALQVRRNLDRELASQNALFAARGQLQGEGTSAAAEKVSRERATESIENARFNTEISAGNAQNRAAIARSEGRAARSAGTFGAIRAVGTFRRPPSLTGGASG